MKRILQLHLFLISCIYFFPVVAQEQLEEEMFSSDYDTTQLITERYFVYGSDFLDFNLEEYFIAEAPHLLPYAEVISHWCGYYSISPKVLLTLIEMQSKLVSLPNSAESLNYPLVGIAQSVGFEAQVTETLTIIYNAFYNNLQEADQYPEKIIEDTDNAAIFSLKKLFREEDVNRSPLYF